MTESPHEPARRRPGRRVAAAAVCAVQGLVLLAFCVYYLVELGRGSSQDAVRVVMSALLIAVFGGALLALARAWLTPAGWPRTPTLVWDVLLLPVAWGLHQSGQDLVAVAVGASALAGVVSAAGASSSSG